MRICVAGKPLEDSVSLFTYMDQEKLERHRTKDEKPGRDRRNRDTQLQRKADYYTDLDTDKKI